MNPADEDIACRYQVLEELGRGSFGVVYKGIEKATGETVAIKHIDLESSDDDIQEIQGEISVLSTCASSFVTQYKGCFLRGHKLWIIMEYLGGGSCLDLLKPANFPESHIAIVCRELLRGLEYLHSEGKIHRDIKAANVLLSDSGKVKLADFGVAAQLTNIKSQRNTFVGTPFWMAPEVIQQDGYSFKADIWSLAITAMEMANGEPPLAHIHPMKVLFHIPKNNPPRLEGSNFSKDFKDFIAQCLVKDPDRRPTAKELLRHRFIRSAGKIEALQELIARRQQWDAGKERRSHPVFYQETLQSISPKDDADEWTFDTVKSVAPKRPTVVRSRKPSSIFAAEEAMRKLDVEDGPLRPSTPVSGTVRRSTVRRQPSLMAVGHSPQSAGSLRRQPSAYQPHSTQSSAGSVRRLPSSAQPKIASNGSTRITVAKRPLQPDMSFGNSGSTMRLFRRVPSDGSTSGQIGQSGSPPDSLFGDENRPPIPRAMTPTEATSKEALLGRRLYARALDPSLAELHAQTSGTAKREALGKLSDAFALLDAVDPEGAYHFLQNLVSSVAQDGKLSAAFLGQVAGKGASAGTPQGTMLVKSALPPAPISAPISPTKPAPISPMKAAPTSPTKGAPPSPTKLVMASNNPHLKSHRRRQDLSTLEAERDGETEGEKGYPGKEALPGMEHCRQLSDVLYSRWVDGLRLRWPAV
ncbi:related to Ste20-like kinase Don3 [Cephalotrichum gorgonifer]|uniref:non-specific serine/threonine protein kinase n=1 Tax=Cephalotrichum gorgonifer TaxID=2041049 RepID=A0AAE8MU61_9PEZI|nr:related to Ste20-like kinase Don3 [Cephalotrichum gorgonifer]